MLKKHFLETPLSYGEVAAERIFRLSKYFHLFFLLASTELGAKMAPELFSSANTKSAPE